MAAPEFSCNNFSAHASASRVAESDARKSARPTRIERVASQGIPVVRMPESVSGETRRRATTETSAGTTPSRVSGKAKRALGPTQTRSAASASPPPPPMTGPSTPHRSGIGSVRSFRYTSARLVANRPASSGSSSGTAYRSMPEQNTLPRAVKRTTRVEASSLTASIARDSSPIISSERAFLFSGRFSVMRASPPAISCRIESLKERSSTPGAVVDDAIFRDDAPPKVVPDLLSQLRWHLQRHAKEGLGVGLSLSVEPEGDRTPTPERLVNEEVESAQIGKLMALDFAVGKRPEKHLGPAPQSTPGKGTRTTRRGVR